MRRALVFLLPLLLVSTGCRPPAELAANPGERASDRAASIFFAGPIPRFDVRIGSNFVQSLREDPRKSVPATVIVGSNVFESVSVHVKGAAGSTRSVDENPALTLNFGKFKEGQDAFGLRKLHLNNSVQDPSRLDELVASTIYRRAGVPTARTTHALVTLNGRDLGLYVLKEGYDKTFIRRNFPHGTNESGNLYDGGFVRDIDQDLNREVGVGTNSYADLKRLRDAVNTPVPERAAKLQAVLDMDGFLTFCAIQSLTDDWDGYARNHNNYRLYCDGANGRFHFIPHGMDQLFANPGQPLEPGWNSLVAERVFELPGNRELFYDRVATLTATLFTADTLTNLVATTEAKFRQALTNRPSEELTQLLNETAGLRERLLERVRNVEQQLAMRPKPVRFDAHGEFAVGGWQPRPDTGDGVAEVVSLSPERRALHLVARSGGTVAGFRAPLRLPAGEYTFSARVRSSGLVALKDTRGEGAGLRVGGAGRTNALAGTTDWKQVTHDFELPAGRDLELVAEIRADAGEAWFEIDSLKLTRRSKP